MAPELFRLQYQTGAPPDFFCTLPLCLPFSLSLTTAAARNGQNWGFPTYNWEAMAADGYAWWRVRLQAMARYFQAYRIDHILGFFRIWEIPGHCVTGISGTRDK
jgi:4-alpha-glucanotransferase